MMEDSPFHPIHEDRIILETEHAVAFWDNYPVSEGHSLVVPKQVVASLYELEPSNQAELWDAARQVRDLLIERYEPAGFNIGVNDGRVAGQTIAHAHIHVIPRYEGDMPDSRGGIRWIIPKKAKYWN